MKICPACSREYGDDEEVCRTDAVSLVKLETGAVGAAQDLIGQVIHGRYRVERIVGRGGMGTVYACRQVIVGKTFAMKVLRSGIERSEEVLQRFIREAQAANAVQSRHICEMMDFGQMPNGSFYIVMELLDGMSLTRVLRELNLGRRELKHIFVQIAETLQKAHDQHIVHRDMKPDNVVLVHDEGDPYFVKLVDFGIAKIMQKDATDLTETGIILGTPYYMSPEQARGDVLDHRSDIYALGVMMYRAFTGKLPFVADTAMGVLTRHLTEKPQLPSQLAEMDATTERLILRCLEKRAIDRFQSMTDLAAAIRSIPDELRQSRTLPTDPSPPTRPTRERQATPTRIDTPLARLNVDGTPAAPDSVSPDTNEPKSGDPTPLVVPRGALARPAGTLPELRHAPQPLPSYPEPRAALPSDPDPRAALPSYPDPRAALPSYPDPRVSQSRPPGPISGNYPMSASQPVDNPRAYPSGPYATATPSQYPPALSPFESGFPPHLQGESPTHRGLAATPITGKNGLRTSRWTLAFGAMTFLLLGGGIGIFALRGNARSAGGPGVAAPSVEPTPSPGRAPNSAVAQPSSVVSERLESEVTANPTSSPSAATAARPPVSSKNGVGLPSGAAPGPATGAGPSGTARPAGGDEIRSPFE